WRKSLNSLGVVRSSQRMAPSWPICGAPTSRQRPERAIKLLASAGGISKLRKNGSGEQIGIGLGAWRYQRTGEASQLQEGEACGYGRPMLPTIILTSKLARGTKTCLITGSGIWPSPRTAIGWPAR